MDVIDEIRSIRNAARIVPLGKRRALPDIGKTGIRVIACVQIFRRISCGEVFLPVSMKVTGFVSVSVS
jgi:hypothetical protein